MGWLLNLGTLVTSWRLWFMVLLEPFSLVSQTVIHGCVFCISPQRSLLEFCLHCIMNILFLDVDHLLQRESGEAGNELFLK